MDHRCLPQRRADIARQKIPNYRRQYAPIPGYPSIVSKLKPDKHIDRGRQATYYEMIVDGSVASTRIGAFHPNSISPLKPVIK